MDSSVFARPCVFALDENEMVCAASSKGFLYLLDLTTGLERSKLKLSSEVFSSPVCKGGKLFVGCRDNNLYSLKVEI